MNLASLSSLARRAGSSAVSASLRPTAVLPAVAVTTTTSRRFAHTLKDEYEYIKVDKTDGGVGVITLHRPKALNALCDDLFADLVHAGQALDASPEIGCMVLTGSQKAFAAGADISEMKDRTFDVAYQTVRTRARQLVVFSWVSLSAYYLFDYFI